MNDKLNFLYAVAEISNYIEMKLRGVIADFDGYVSKDSLNKLKNWQGWPANVDYNDLVQLTQLRQRLQNYTQSYAFMDVDLAFSRDEAIISKKSHRVETEFLKGREIIVGQEMKPILKGLSLSIPLILQLIRSSNDVFYCHDENSKNIFCSNKFEIRSRKVTVVFHLQPGKENERSIFRGVEMHDINNKFSLSSLSFFSEYSESSNPIRLFLKSIQKYGNEFAINDKEKKLFIEETFSELDINNIIALKLNDSINNPLQFVRFALRKKGTKTVISFAYLLDYSKIIGSLKRFEF
ncbi:hypothetical protein H8B13_09060 [Hymenobacter sp. BT188]|uniref:hypothetical protein n=1 Tax=Hymenobacter sp. BT188 TaxID=2763504 RepID=UPI001651A248|nr:hypothetical protein [Hymenobacter sp. BT188]MBC6606965.1 hypothetical protein [Hymenobacter sp. BT188]